MSLSLTTSNNPELTNGRIGFVNGINNTLAEAEKHALFISDSAQGTKVHFVYHPTQNLTLDVLTCIFSDEDSLEPTEALIRNEWKTFFENQDDQALFFQLCHSQGAKAVKNALLASPEAIRKRIIVVAIAPSSIIPSSLCHKAFNYASKRDFITHLDFKGKEHKRELTLLDPAKDAPKWDHDFRSPTFQNIIQKHISEYLSSVQNCRTILTS